MALPSSAPLFAYSAATAATMNTTQTPSPSTCASPATSTDSRTTDDAAAATSVLSPSSRQLPGLQFAIAHRRAELRLPLPSLTTNTNGTRSGADQENVAMNATTHHQHHQHYAHLYLSMPQCESPHYQPGVPQCPETSPLDKHQDAKMMENDANKKRKKGTRRGTLNAEAKNVLKAWMFSPEHFAHPYPSEEEKEELAQEAGIEVKQLSNWFTNARKRLWQPVLRQSGVEVKNFLSTGRGGPRGNKLDVPANLQHLIAQREADGEDDASPPSSPSSGTMVDGTAPVVASLKRSWAEMHSSPAPSGMPVNVDAVAPKTQNKKKSLKYTTEKQERGLIEDVMTKTASQLSQELRLALDAHRSQTLLVLESRIDPSVNSFKDIEILAATSLIGLHHQTQPFQPVH